MEYFAGLDVSMEETRVCVIDRDGKVILEARTPTVPKAIAAAFAKGPAVERVLFETGRMAPTLFHGLTALGHRANTNNWQQHSVRGFLAGTVKKKLGFSLTSVKPNDGVRRYRMSRGAAAEMTKPSINLAEELARLSVATIFELRGEWRRLHRMPPPMRLSRDLLMPAATVASLQDLCAAVRNCLWIRRLIKCRCTLNVL